MKKKLMLIMGLSISFICHADFNAGLIAYNKGDYKTALKLWQDTTKKTVISDNFEWHSDSMQETNDAQYAIAFLYWQGKGVKQNYKTAEKWLIPAAINGHSEAQLKLAYLYMTGLTNKPDYSQAKQWLEKSAAQNNIDAHYNLALLYFKGLGVKQDIEKAKEWLVLPVEKKDAAAIDLLAQLNNTPLQTVSLQKNDVIAVNNDVSKKEIPAEIDNTQTVIKESVATKNEFYAIQLIASEKQEAVLELMEKWHDSLNPLIMFSKLKNNQSIFVLAYGNYASVEEAKQAISLLPVEFKKNKPWITKVPVNSDVYQY